MECTKCHKKNIEPLELYTGDMACPKCRNRLNLIPKRISASSSRACELLSLSELYYHYALCKNAKITTTELVNTNPLTAEEMVEKAVEYCREAMDLGHPEAVWRMAFFYHKNYVKNAASESIRYRTAAQLYLGLVSYPDTHFEGYEDNEAADNTLLLKRRAADDLFALLSELPRRDRQLYSSKLMELGFLSTDAAAKISSHSEKSGTEELMRIFHSAISKQRAPLFGVVRIKKELLGRIAEEISATSVVKNRKIDLMFIPLNKDDVYDFKNSIGKKSPFHVFRTTASEISQGISMAIEKSAENCCVYFFNKAGKHRFYSSTAKKQALQSDISVDSIDQLISYTPGGSYVFYDDDIFVKNGKIDKIIAEISAKSEV